MDLRNIVWRDGDVQCIYRDGPAGAGRGTEQQVSNVTVVTDDLAGTENNVDTEKEITDAKIVFDSEGMC